MKKGLRHVGAYAIFRFAYAGTNDLMKKGLRPLRYRYFADIDVMPEQMT